MALKDFIYVRRVVDNGLGQPLIIYDNNIVFCIAYKADSYYSLRCAIYHPEPEKFQFIIASDTEITVGDNIRIFLQSPYGGALITSYKVDNPMPYGLSGYYTTMDFVRDRMRTVSDGAKWWNAGEEEEMFTSLSLGTIPSYDSGVIVTINASPLPPSNNGVIVTVIGRLLDPNAQGGTSIPGGGNGTFNDISDPVPIPILPTISAADCGMVTLFRPTETQLKSLASYLWTNLTDFIENLNKLFMNPMDYIISLNIVPCVPDVGIVRPIKIGSVTTTINMPPVLSQWYEFNCGTIQISEYWGSALDYSPNTKISLFLPFIGSVSLNTDEVMGKRLGVVYRIDLLSGQCIAMVTVSSLVDQTDSVYYQYTGECGVSIPMTGADWSRIYSAAIGAVGTALTGAVAAGAAGAAAGGATSALAGAQAADASANAGLAYSMINDTSKGIAGVSRMRAQMLEASQLALDAGRQAASAPASVANGVRAMRIANTINNTVQQVVSGKGYVSHTGTVSASAGILGVKTPYVLIEYPNQSMANNYKHFVGYPSNMYARLGDLSGYTECEQVIPNGLVDQTDMEMAEILEALKGGVYL